METSRLDEPRQGMAGPPAADQSCPAERDSISVIEETAVLVRQLLSAVPPETLLSPLPGGAGTAASVAARIHDVDLVFGYNLRLAFTGPTPRYAAYDETKWPLLPGLPLWQTIHAWENLRAGNLILVHHLVRSGLSRDREGGHTGAGHLICELAAHDRGHIAVIKHALAGAAEHPQQQD